MNVNLADVLLHIDENLSPDEQGRMEKALRSQNGVVSVHFQRNNPHAMMVLYNPDLMHSHDLHQVAEQHQVKGLPRHAGGRELHVELVGF